jgi:hypothetical protein
VYFRKLWSCLFWGALSDKRSFGFWIGHWIYCTLATYNTWRYHQFTVTVNIVLYLLHTVCSSLNTFTESYWSAVLPVLRYWLSMADIPILGLSNCLRCTSTATLDSLVLPLGALSNNFFTGALTTNQSSSDDWSEPSSSF